MRLAKTEQIIDIMRLKGLHLGMKSGMLAAETALDSLRSGDHSAEALKSYEEKINNSYIHKEMYDARNFHQSFDMGLYMGMMRTGIGMTFGTFGRKKGHDDWSQLKQRSGKALSEQPKVDVPTFTAKLDDVYLSGVLHEEDQPSHLKVADPTICSTKCAEEFGNPCTRFCPAQVYEMVADEENEGQKKLQVNFSNCVHCKTCDIKDPYQIITWTPPEGGGGPGYKMT